MRKSTIIWLVIAVALILLGSILFVSMMTTLKWDFTKISTEKYKTERYEITDAFHSISVNISTADITVLPAEDGVARVVCFENEKLPHEVSVVEGVLTVNRVDNRHHWYDYVTIFDFHTPKITVYLPEAAYTALTVKGSTGDVEIARDLEFESITVEATTGDITCYASASGSIRLAASTGDITLQGISAGTVSLSVTTGDITASNLTVAGAMEVTVSTGEAELTSVTCLSLMTTGDTGDLDLDGVLVDGPLSVKRSTGDVSLSACDAHELTIETSTGSVTGSLLSEKVFIVNTDTGKKEVPATLTGGKCAITTDTGDIHIRLVSK